MPSARLMAMETDVRLTSAKDYARLILEKRGARPVVPEGWFDVDLDAAPRLDVFWLDEDDPGMRRVPTNRDWLRE